MTTVAATRKTNVLATVVVPYLSRREHLDKSLPAWLSQTRKPEIVVVDFSRELFLPEEVRVVPCSGMWNINRARNVGARTASGELLIFACADTLPNPDFVETISNSWDQADAWVCETVARSIPHDPSVDGFVVVKRWANSRIRGFSEGMMENPHGWGYDAADYLARLRKMLSSCGGVVF